MIERTFATTGPVDLDVGVPAGSVTIEASGDNTVDVSVETSKPDEWIVSQTGDSIVVRHERSGGWPSGGRGRVRIALPQHSDVRVSTASADISLGVPTRTTRINTASGEVRITSAADLTVKTASGDVRVGDVTKDATIGSASGDLEARTVQGHVSASTASGDIRVEVIGSGLKANTASGDITVDRFEGSSVSAHSMSGDIVLGLPPGRSVELDASSVSGQVYLPENRSTGTGSAGTRVSIKVKTVSGDIRLHRTD